MFVYVDFGVYMFYSQNSTSHNSFAMSLIERVCNVQLSELLLIHVIELLCLLKYHRKGVINPFMPNFINRIFCSLKQLIFNRLGLIFQNFKFMGHQTLMGFSFNCKLILNHRGITLSERSIYFSFSIQYQYAFLYGIFHLISCNQLIVYKAFF